MIPKKHAPDLIRGVQRFRQRSCSNKKPRRLSPYPALVDRRAGVSLHSLAQIGDQPLVGHELPIVVRHLVRRERLETSGGGTSTRDENEPSRLCCSLARNHVR